MSRIHPIQILLDEHSLIEQALSALESALQRLKSAPSATTVVEKALHFLQDFADGPHMAKEEAVLFPVLKRKGLSAAAHDLMDEHRAAHQRLTGIGRKLRDAVQGDGPALAFIRSQGLAYVALVRDHIREEDKTLFQLARQVLTEQDIDELDRLFGTTDAPALDPVILQELQHTARRLPGAA